MKCEFSGKAVLLAFVLLFTGLLVATTARADELYARVRGTVSDASGAVVGTTLTDDDSTA